MHNSELIDHVSSTTMTDVSRVASVQQGRLISPLGRIVITRTSRAARHDRNPRLGAFRASEGVRLPPGTPRAAARHAKSGALKAASAKAAKGPPAMTESVRLR